MDWILSRAAGGPLFHRRWLKCLKLLPQGIYFLPVCLFSIVPGPIQCSLKQPLLTGRCQRTICPFRVPGLSRAHYDLLAVIRFYRHPVSLPKAIRDRRLVMQEPCSHLAVQLIEYRILAFLHLGRKKEGCGKVGAGLGSAQIELEIRPSKFYYS